MENKSPYEDLNPNFYCPITDELMVDPVIDHEGNSYERAAIEKWLRQNPTNPTSPITRMPLQLADLTPNRALRSAIESEISSGKNLAKKAIRNKNSDKKENNYDFKMVNVAADAKAEISQSVVDDNVQLKITAGLSESDENCENENLVLISIMPPERTVRVPADICCVVDISGSMSADASNLGTESGGLTILDIVKHAVTTIIKTLADNDRLALVTYSSNATVIFGLLPMTDYGKSRALELLRGLRADGMTNLWDGLQKGLDVLKAGSENRGRAGNASIMLLTDGIPNVDPPRGYVPMLQRYREKCGGKLPGTITTFGFGYQLNSSLLRELAVTGGSHYGFIPDSGMVGTSFVNALANILCTSIKDTSLVLEPINGARFSGGKPLGGIPCKVTSHAIIIDIGDLQTGQSRDVIIKMVLPTSNKAEAKVMNRYEQLAASSSSSAAVAVAAPSLASNTYIRAKLSYRHAGSNDTKVSTVEGPSSLVATAASSTVHDLSTRLDQVDNFLEVSSQAFRLRTVATLDAARQCADIYRVNDLPGGRQLITNLSSEIQHWLQGDGARLGQGRYDSSSTSNSPWNRIEALLEDLNGQALEAFSRPEWFEKWGMHYIPSLARAHQLQQCTNFKDPGMQFYGGDMFKDVRDYADEVFCSLPAPTVIGPVVVAAAAQHSNAATPAARSPAPIPQIDMRRFNNPNNPCFHGDCTVRMSDGTTKLVREVRKGDLLTGSRNSNGDGDIVEQVECVVRTDVDGGCTELVELRSEDNQDNANDNGSSNTLLVTPWHPILYKGQWSFPVSVSPQSLKVRPCDAVYSFVLYPRDRSDEKDGKQRRGNMVIGGFEVATLAHGIPDEPVVSHDFFGTEAIVVALSKCPGNGWSRGEVHLRAGAMDRRRPDVNSEKSCKDTESVGLVHGIKPDHFIFTECN